MSQPTWIPSNWNGCLQKIGKQKNYNKQFFRDRHKVDRIYHFLFSVTKAYPWYLLLWKSARLHSWNHVQHNSLPKDLICLSLTLNLAINICLDYSGFHILWPVQACFLQGCIRQHFNFCKYIGWVDKYCIFQPNNISTNIEMPLLSKLYWLCKCNEILWSKTFSFLKISFLSLFQHSPIKRE